MPNIDCDFKILVIDSNGENLGEMKFQQAREISGKKNMDLLKVGNKDSKKVYKIVDKNKLKYDKKKAAKKNKKSGKNKTKELRFNVNIDKHDMKTKIKHLKEFISKNNSVYIQVILSGRDATRPEIGMQKMEDILDSVREISKIDNIKTNISPRRVRVTTMIHPI